MKKFFVILSVLACLGICACDEKEECALDPVELTIIDLQDKVADIDVEREVDEVKDVINNLFNSINPAK